MSAGCFTRQILAMALLLCLIATCCKCHKARAKATTTAAPSSKCKSEEKTLCTELQELRDLIPPSTLMYITTKHYLHDTRFRQAMHFLHSKDFAKFAGKIECDAPFQQLLHQFEAAGVNRYLRELGNITGILDCLLLPDPTCEENSQNDSPGNLIDSPLGASFEVMLGGYVKLNISKQNAHKVDIEKVEGVGSGVEKVVTEAVRSQSITTLAPTRGYARTTANQNAKIVQAVHVYQEGKRYMAKQVVGENPRSEVLSTLAPRKTSTGGYAETTGKPKNTFISNSTSASFDPKRIADDASISEKPINNHQNVTTTAKMNSESVAVIERKDSASSSASVIKEAADEDVLGANAMSARTCHNYLTEIMKAMPRWQLREAIVNKARESKEFAQFYKTMRNDDFRRLALDNLNSNQMMVPLYKLRKNYIDLHRIILMIFRIFSWGPTVQQLEDGHTN